VYRDFLSEQANPAAAYTSGAQLTVISSLNWLTSTSPPTSRRVGIVHVGRRGVAGPVRECASRQRLPRKRLSYGAGERFEVGVAVAAAVDVHCVAIGEVEVCFEHAAPGI
jgi:hypothetical protein